MIWSGVKLMFIGMGVVYIYLAVMIFLIQATARLLRSITLSEETNRKQNTPPPKPAGAQKANKSKTVAVISAAIQKHRSNS